MINVFKARDGRWSVAPEPLRNWPQFCEAGQYDSKESAIEAAQQQYPRNPIKVDVRSWGYLLWRFVVRTFRVCAGLPVAYLAVAHGFPNAIDLLSKPFAELSPLGLLGGIALGALSLVGLVAGFVIAFGPPPPDPQVEIAPLSA